jgi:hypothetical protein
MPDWMQSDKFGHDTGVQQMMPGVRHREPPPAYQSDRQTRTDLRKAQLALTARSIELGVEREELKTLIAMITPEEEEVPVITSLEEKSRRLKEGKANMRDQQAWAKSFEPVVKQWSRTKPQKGPNTSENRPGATSFYDALAHDLKTHAGLWGLIPHQTREPRTEPVLRALSQRLETEGEVEVIIRQGQVWAIFRPHHG